MQLLRLGQFHVFSGLGFLKFVIFAVFIRVISCVRTKLGILRVLVLVRVFCHYNIINLMILLLRVSLKSKLMIAAHLIFFSQKLLSIKGKMEKYKTKSNPSHHENNKSSKQIIIISTHKFLRKVLAFCLVNIKT